MPEFWRRAGETGGTDSYAVLNNEQMVPLLLDVMSYS